MPPTNYKRRVLIVDDHKLFTDGFQLALKKFDFIQVVGIYHRAEKCLEELDDKHPDLIFMDISLKGMMDGIQATQAIHKTHPNIIIIAVSMHDDGLTVQQMLKAGASAYITKDLSITKLNTVFDKIWKGEIYIAPTAASNCAIHSVKIQDAHETKPSSLLNSKDFSSADLQMIQLISEGKTDKEIADVLSITKKVVEYEKGKIYKKLGVKNAAAMISTAFKLKLLPI